MASAFQNRLVGTVVLVALAVIFVPEYLDGEKQVSTMPVVAIPLSQGNGELKDVPPIATDEIASRVSREIEVLDEQPVDDNEAVTEGGQADVSVPPVAPVESVESANMPVVAVAPVAVAPEPGKTLGGGWVIQLGSFRHQKNVRNLLDKLENAGYRAFSRPVKTRSGNLIKVFVGPDLERAELDKALPHLTELTGLKGKITTFDIE